MNKGQENGGQWKRGGGEWKQRTEEDKQEEAAGIGGHGGQGTGDRWDRWQWIGGRKLGDIRTGGREWG